MNSTAHAALRRRKKTALLSLSALVLISSLAYSLLSHSGIMEISSGRVYKSAALPAEELRAAVKELSIKTVIDFRETVDDVEQERAVLESMNVAHYNLPTPQVPSDETVARYLELLEDESIYPVLIHCEHGYGRAELFGAIYRMEFENWDNEEAREATRPALRLPFSGFALDESKGEYLHNYRPRRATRLSALEAGKP